MQQTIKLKLRSCMYIEIDSIMLFVTGISVHEMLLNQQVFPFYSSTSDSFLIFEKNKV